jgi:polyphosphate kinase 2 (PPK2 family)
MLIRSGIQIVKYYLDIGRKEQKRRLRKRGLDPLKQWKVSPIDSAALEHWDDYTQARDEMLELTSRPPAPWIIVKADDKRSARLNIIRDLLTRVECPKARKHLANPDREIAFEYSPAELHRLAR